MPWRHTQDPYPIWLSEIILQQTRVQQGLPYYERFLATFPTVRVLSEAKEEEVLRLWQGLGYYSRARNLHACARTIVEEHNGQFPDNFKDLLKLKGIGRYTAAAIASFAFGEVVPVVDGNVYRVLARLFGISTNIALPAAQKEFFTLASEIIDPEQPDTFNQAIMEFGAMHCTPQKPLCLYCPLQDMCYAFQHSQQKDFPVKKKEIKVKHRYFHYFIILSPAGKILMRTRPEGDIWRGLYDFYLVEADRLLEADEIKDEGLQQLKAKNSILMEESKAFKHQLTHQLLQVKFFVLQVGEETFQEFMIQKPGLQAFNQEDTIALPKPVVVKNFLEKLNF